MPHLVFVERIERLSEKAPDLFLVSLELEVLQKGYADRILDVSTRLSVCFLEQAEHAVQLLPVALRKLVLGVPIQVAHNHVKKPLVLGDLPG